MNSKRTAIENYTMGVYSRRPVNYEEPNIVFDIKRNKFGVKSQNTVMAEFLKLNNTCGGLK